MKGKIVNWGNIDSKGTKADWSNPEHRKLIVGALQHFSKQYHEACLGFRMAQTQHFGKSENFPTSILQVMDKFRESLAFDNAWEQIFKVHDFTDYRRDGFKIATVGDGLTFKKVAKGDKADVYSMGGEEITVPFNMYGGALGWHKTLFDDEEYYTMEDMAFTFVNKAAEDRAANAYALIEAIGSGINLAWQAVTPASVATSNENYDAIRDFNTINKAVQNLFDNNRSKGYGVSTNTRFKLLYPYQLRSRIQRALGMRNMNISGDQPGMVYNVDPLETIGLSSATSYYVCLPGAKTQWGDRMRLTIETEMDALSYSEIAVGWQRFGGGIGDTQQFVRCATS
jgi:hypothetical protein